MYPSIHISIYIYIYTHTHTHTYIYIYLHIYIHIHKYIHIALFIAQGAAGVRYMHADLDPLYVLESRGQAVARQPRPFSCFIPIAVFLPVESQ